MNIINQMLAETVKTTIYDIGSSVSAFQTAANNIDMKNYERLGIWLILKQSGAGTATVTLKQATDTAGSDDKALAFAKYWKNETGVSTDALTEVEASTLTTAGPTTGLNVYYFDIRADRVDAANNFRFIRMDVASLSNNDVAAIVYQPYGGKQIGAPDDMPTGM